MTWPPDIDLPEDIRLLVEKMMEKDPANRFQHPDETVSGIEEALRRF